MGIAEVLVTFIPNPTLFFLQYCLYIQMKWIIHLQNLHCLLFKEHKKNHAAYQQYMMYIIVLK